MTAPMTSAAAAGLMLALVVAGCTPEPVPELIAAAGPDSGAPLVLRGAPLDQCLAGSSYRKISWAEAAAYNAGATCKAASRIHYAFDKNSEHVTRLRVYEISGTTSGLFGKGEAHLACFFEMKDGQLVFLHELALDDDGRVDYNEYNGALRIVYRRLSGASYWETFI